MKAEITRHALDRVPLSIIIDDSTVLLNLNYFWIRDRIPVDGEARRWEDVPVVHPESFTREFAEFCLQEGVRGKFSIVPCPAGIGRVDEDLPLISRQQQDSWLAMCRELIVPAFDITPEMLTHTVVVDPESLQPVSPSIWEQYEWATLPEHEPERITAYVAAACRILVETGFDPVGVTSPGGFGGRTLAFYAKMAGEGVRQVTGLDVPYFFQRTGYDAAEIDTPVWYPDREAGTAVGEIIAGTRDWTGSWTGYDEVDADKYITADLAAGRLPALIDAGQPAVLISHWQGFYGMHDEDRGGFKAFQSVVRRLRERDPRGEVTRWRKPSQITRYACAREMADVRATEDGVELDLPVLVPEMTLRLSAAPVQAVSVDGSPLQRVEKRSAFETGTYLVDGEEVLIAFDPAQRRCRIKVDVGS